MKVVTRDWVFGIVLVIFAAGMGIWIRNHEFAWNAGPLTFSDTSDKLSRTVILPSLDTRIPENKSAMWCASLPQSWGELTKLNGGSPPVVKGLETLCQQLHVAEIDKQVPAQNFAIAGYGKEGIANKIREEMSKRFPGVPAQTIQNADPASILAFAYLQANVKFTIPYFNLRTRIEFTAADGTKTIVPSFGIGYEHDYAYEKLREQLSVLFAVIPSRKIGEEANPSPAKREIALDLCNSSHDNRVILAMIPRQATLGAMIEYVSRRSNDPKKRTFPMGDSAVVACPNFAFRIEHQFSELMGKDKVISNGPLAGQWFGSVQQVIEFRLDKSGVSLRSESGEEVKSNDKFGPIVFDEPFLIMMTRRDSDEPFFAMWVDNAELIKK